LRRAVHDERADRAQREEDGRGNDEHPIHTLKMDRRSLGRP
jgi:hypothetical protein